MLVPTLIVTSCPNSFRGFLVPLWLTPGSCSSWDSLGTPHLYTKFAFIHYYAYTCVTNATLLLLSHAHRWFGLFSTSSRMESCSTSSSSKSNILHINEPSSHGVTKPSTRKVGSSRSRRHATIVALLVLVVWRSCKKQLLLSHSHSLLCCLLYSLISFFFLSLCTEIPLPPSFPLGAVNVLPLTPCGGAWRRRIRLNDHEEYDNMADHAVDDDDG